MEHKMKRYLHGGRPVHFRTWLGLWMECQGLTGKQLARILMCGKASVTRWRSGGYMSRHFSTLLRALYPEAPVHRYGGRILLLVQRLPVNARTPKLYRFLLRQLGMIHDSAQPQKAWPIAMEEARRRSVDQATLALQPSEGAIAPSEPYAQ